MNLRKEGSTYVDMNEITDRVSKIISGNGNEPKVYLLDRGLKIYVHLLEIVYATFGNLKTKEFKSDKKNKNILSQFFLINLFRKLIYHSLVEIFFLMAILLLNQEMASRSTKSFRNPEKIKVMNK